MGSKPIGKCPFCGEMVRAVVVEENTIRRDVCECPECGESILVCRSSGCQDFAKGGSIYDDDFCPGCQSGIRNGVKDVGTVVFGAVLVGLVAKFMDDGEA